MLMTNFQRYKYLFFYNLIAKLYDFAGFFRNFAGKMYLYESK